MTEKVVDIADRVWPAARAIYEEDEEGFLRLLLAPSGDHGEADRALERCVPAARDAMEEESMGSAGEWDWVRVPDGVFIKFGDSLAFEPELRVLAAELARAGIGGTIDLYELPSTPEPPWTEDVNDLLECRVRIRGRRERRDPRAYWWHPDLDAYAAWMEAADGWRRRLGADAISTLTQDIMPPVPVAPGEDVLDRMRFAAAYNRHINVSSAWEEGSFRSVTARPYTGSMSLLVGGESVRRDWRPQLAELIDLLREHAGLLAHGFLRRGWSVGASLFSDVLWQDWPERPDYRPRGTGWTADAFDDVYAPDAFGVQLLGPGYDGRIPNAAPWRATRAGTASVLLEHEDPAPWFDAPFISPPSRDSGPAPTPAAEVLTHARTELAGILYTPGALSRDGYAAPEEQL